MKLVGFDVGDRVLAVPLERVREVVHAPVITWAPGLPSAVLGVGAVRGTPVPVVDASLLFFGRRTTVDGRTPVVVVDVRGARGSMDVALMVDRLRGELEADGFLPGGGRAWRSGAGVASLGVVESGGVLVLVLDVDGLLADPVAAGGGAAAAGPSAAGAGASDASVEVAEPADAAPCTVEATRTPAAAAVAPSTRGAASPSRVTTLTALGARRKSETTRPARATPPPPRPAGGPTPRGDPVDRPGPIAPAPLVAQVTAPSREPTRDAGPPPPRPTAGSTGATAPPGRSDKSSSRGVRVAMVAVASLALVAGLVFAFGGSSRDERVEPRPTFDGAAPSTLAIVATPPDAPASAVAPLATAKPAVPAVHQVLATPATPADAPTRAPSPAPPPIRATSPAPPPIRATSPAPPPTRAPSPAPPPIRAPSPAPPPIRATSPAPPPSQPRATSAASPCEAVVVEAGDTLWAIAKRTLGDPFAWPRIAERNRRRITDPNLIRVGDRISVRGTCPDT